MTKVDLKALKRSNLVVGKSYYATPSELLSDSIYLNGQAEAFMKSMSKALTSRNKAVKNALLSYLEQTIQNQDKRMAFGHKLLELPLLNQQHVLLLASSYDLRLGHEVVRKILQLLRVEQQT